MLTHESAMIPLVVYLYRNNGELITILEGI